MGVGFVQGPEGPPTRVFTVGVWIAIFGIIGLTWAWATKPSGRGR